MTTHCDVRAIPPFHAESKRHPARKRGEQDEKGQQERKEWSGTHGLLYSRSMGEPSRGGVGAVVVAFFCLLPSGVQRMS
ncbi:MAG: hypothetical protein LBD68_02770, partial [Zoogloeaceae bacterium]|nr:hypothetical protein [Zoogloeaceae bacterium]